MASDTMAKTYLKEILQKSVLLPRRRATCINRITVPEVAG